jgi:N12 class adenine-specific DNA methylase
MFVCNNIKYYKRLKQFKVETQKDYRKYVLYAETLEKAKEKLQELKNSFKKEEIKIDKTCKIKFGKIYINI